ncbi:DUF2283 domain-containing protein [Methermicoccus shengliensis]|uniref:DUF2283 domain-containing protein n=1 Tax=Methermicoccus shengliensis TaxID=660064 RepID=A0A832VZI1_9EURY|nr:DUF2283 domain-containing protein [Methermicoccus shengliensis]KUK05123.1 MAG: Uncharacterized protein XD46_0116 [Euryarchaeota archaeon 55_53]KUK30689.1 MAG: Uncharacterized protein XD62_0198 [Methanosarcinales archeaon 56_1174]MDI3488439.1 hypothetical protein [Methanosarcinales archaeon]MDN5294642.1 hypothetical protein [Methanosarcinales archaeon]HIH69350.1 DUF2283 domain-containing protein [Methermicoccus shengliensis]
MAEEVKKIVDAVPMLLNFPTKRFHVDYDKEADVLYISFERPQKATDTEVTEEGILLRYREDKLVGITVLNASRFKVKV